jgi:hypothetical protein
MDKITQDILASQSQVIATLALRISVLERLLLEKKLISEDEIRKESDVLSKEFVAQTKEALRKAAESKRK